MKILAIDTTENTATAAILEDEKLLGSIQLTRAKNHSEAMLPMIDDLLCKLQLSLPDVDLFALSAGPGSFTGVRIGAATVKGLTFGREKTIVPVSGIEAMAYLFVGMDGLLCPGMDARRGQVYSAIFRVQGEKIERLTEDRVILIPDLMKELAAYGEKVRFCGGGYDLMRDAALSCGIAVCEVPEPLRYEHAWGVGRLAYLRYRESPETACKDTALKPIYLQLAQAERERIEKEKQAETQKAIENEASKGEIR